MSYRESRRPLGSFTILLAVASLTIPGCSGVGDRVTAIQAKDFLRVFEVTGQVQSDRRRTWGALGTSAS